MSKQVKDSFYKSKDLRKKILKYFNENDDGYYFSKERFSKFWKTNISSLDILLDFFDSISIRIGITPSKFGNYWTTIVHIDNNIFIQNDYCGRKYAVEGAINKVINIINERSN